MRLLMLGFDPGIVADRPANGDTRERHEKYAGALRRRYPDGQIDVIVRVARPSTAWSGDVAEGLRVHLVPCRRAAFGPSALRVARELARHGRFDLVTTQTPFDDGALGVWLQRRLGLALHVQMRSSFLDQPWWVRQRPVLYRLIDRLGRWVARRADSIRVVSRGEKDRLGRRFPELASKIVFLHPLVNRQVFETPIAADELEPVRGLLRQRQLESTPFLLYVGRLSREKNVDTLLRAFALASRAAPAGALVLVGDGPLRSGLETLAGDLGIRDRVVWTGTLPLESIRAWYATAVGVVQPSFQEGFGKVIVEASLMGVPAIVTPFVSARELVRDGDTGFIASDFTDPGWLASRMAGWLRDPIEAQAMGRRGQTHVRAYLLPEPEYLERLIGIWDDAVERAQRRD